MTTGRAGAGPCSFARLEQGVFRRLNAVVEPAVRHGIGSPSLAPASLIVLETTGFKSGRKRRTPLWSIGLGRYRIVSTYRGDRAFWVKNLLQQSRVRYYLGGKARESDAIVIAPGSPRLQSKKLTPAMRRLTTVFQRLAREGWAFAILVPTRTNARR
jgi:deazaflavin-dependent oxidoreductase (nitroreductase family)